MVLYISPALYAMSIVFCIISNGLMFLASLYSIRKLKVQVNNLLELEKEKYDPAFLTVNQ